jgi:hypothetical protein
MTAKLIFFLIYRLCCQVIYPKCIVSAKSSLGIISICPSQLIPTVEIKPTRVIHGLVEGGDVAGHLGCDRPGEREHEGGVVAGHWGSDDGSWASSSLPELVGGTQV